MFKLYAYTIDHLLNFIADKTTVRAGGCSSSLSSFNLTGPGAAAEWEEFEEQVPEEALTDEEIKITKTLPIESTKCVIDFSTKCNISNNTWQQRVVMLDVGQIPAAELSKIRTFEDLKKNAKVMSGRVRVGCNCPSFVFWGNAYEVDKIDSGEGSLGRYQDNPYPEVRAPTKNVQLPGFLCKHLISVLLKHFG